MKHLLNNLSEEEKNSIREQHSGGMKVNTERFKSLSESKLGNVKPLVEQWDDPDIDDARHTMLRGKGYSHIKNKDDKKYIIFDGQEFSQEDIVFADYQDLGELPRIEDGKLVIAHPAWSM